MLEVTTHETASPSQIVEIARFVDQDLQRASLEDHMAIVADDLDALCRRLVAQSLRIKIALHDYDWGAQHICVTQPGT